jgi:hypothetical protein
VQLPAFFSSAIPGSLWSLLALYSPGMWPFQDCSIMRTTGLGLLTPQCLVRIERPLDLSLFRLRYDLDEHGHHHTGPEGPPERVEQVGQESEKPARRRRQENVSTNMRGQTEHEADPKAPVQDALT